jgi:cell division protein FtsZ
LINITGGLDMALHEVNDVVAIIREAAHEEAHIIFGAVIDEQLEDELRITLIATGFNRPEAEVSVGSRPLRSMAAAYVSEDSFPRSQPPLPPLMEEEEEDVVPAIEPHQRRLDIPTFVRRLVR